MKKFIGIILNTLFFTAVIVISLLISTQALARKVIEYQQNTSQGIHATVDKKTIPILALTKGIVSELHVKTGQDIKRGDVLAKLVNPSLVAQINTLNKFPDNLSAQTEAKVAETQLANLTVKSPINGVAGDVGINIGSPVDDYSTIVTLYSNENIQLLAELTIDQYQAVQKAQQAIAYSQRLNQSFIVVPSILKPDEKTSLNFDAKKIGLYFKFKNNLEASSLLDNEDLVLKLQTNENTVQSRPVDFIVNFWSQFMPKNQNNYAQ